MAVYTSHETNRMNALQGIELASFPRRALAIVLDLAIASLLFAGVATVMAPILVRLGWLRSDQEIVFAINLNWYSIAWIVLYYGLAAYLGNGKTPGKWILGIRIVSTVHTKLTFWHSIERALGYGYSSLELLFGFIQFFLYPNRRTLHDRIAETIVIRDKRKRLSSTTKK